MVSYVLDSSAWFEYFNAGPYGEAVRDLVAGSREVYTPAVVAAEVVEAARLRGGNSKTFLNFLLARSEFLPVTADVARLAGKINAERAHPPNAWTMMESLILATARSQKARLATRDPIFARLEDVYYLPSVRRGPQRSGPASRTAGPAAP